MLDRLEAADSPAELREILTEQSVEAEDELTVRRVIAADGRSRGYLNGVSVPLQLLRDVGSLIVDIHGQHEFQSLTRASAQRELLDDFGEHIDLAGKVREAHKTWIALVNRTVELEGAQRDLYETVRAAMQEKVRAAVTAKGLARSHIIVLEALLKLRQVCCDPRLVNLRQAARIKESAKLELLLDMLPELIEEGRRILLFSQFTGMLDLIAAALDAARIPYVVLTGETTDIRCSTCPAPRSCGRSQRSSVAPSRARISVSWRWPSAFVR